MTLLANLFPKLRTPEKGVRYMSKKSSFKGPFDRQHGKRVQTLLRSGKRVQTLLRSERQHAYHI